MAQYLDKEGLNYYHNKLKTTILDKKLDATTAENTYYPKAGGTIGGSVVITGDLTVNGTQHINNTENLNVKTPMIYSNADGGTLAQLGGIGIKKNATDVYGIVYDPADDAVKLGLGKSDASGTYTFNTDEGNPVAIRDDSTKITNDHILKWDGTKKKLIDAGKSINDINASINAKYTKPSSGIPKSDLDAGVKASLDKADTALQSHQSLADYAKLSGANTFAKLNTFDGGIQIPNGGAFNIGTKAADAPWVGIASKENVTATLTHNHIVRGKAGGIADTIGYLATGSFTPTGTNIRNVSITSEGAPNCWANYNGTEITWRIYAQSANASVVGEVTYISDSTVTSPAFVSHTQGAAGQESYALLPPNKSGMLALVEDISDNVSTIPNEDIDKLFV